MVEKFVSITSNSDKGIWSVEIVGGKYYISYNGSPLCYGQAIPNMTCEQTIRHCCGGEYRKVG